MSGGRAAVGWVGLLALLPLLLGGCGPRPSGEPVEVGGERFYLELALDPRSRSQGLMRRSHLDPRGGMLFVFPDARPRAFWMGHCRIDIDVIFLDSRGVVLATHAMKQEPPQGPTESDPAYRRRLPSYRSGGPARYAIELLGGSLGRLELRPGDRIELDHGRLQVLAR